MEQREFCDYLTSYRGISEMLKTRTYEEILCQAAGLMGKMPQEMETYAAGGYPSGGCYQYVLEDALKNTAQYDWLYQRLADSRSRMIFASLTGYRVLPAESFLRQAAGLSGDHVIKDREHCMRFAGEDSISSVLEAGQKIRDHVSEMEICIDHTVSSIWEIPRLMDAIRSDFRLFIRYHECSEHRETILYAVLPEKKSNISPKGRKRIVAMAPYERGWTNAELLKDCGLIPYLLSKNHECDVRMVSAPMEDCSNQKYIKGVKLEFLPDGRRETKADYIRKEAKNIDCLVLRGLYRDHRCIVEVYKKYNPQGKVFLPLDANSNYMDRIQWDESDLRRFMEQCDVISTSGLATQRYLNEKWPWVIEHVPNGFYHFTDREWDPSFDKKKNTILTVGRLGTSQKATEVLLEAFAGIAEKIPGWELHLAGSVEASFEDYLERFREQFPNLTDRIHFLGHITDRDLLYEEYLKAKIFALPSVYEGGTPNVIAEALYAGDVIAVTKIDEYEEATDYGRCGMASEIGDVQGFQNVLLKLCQSEYLREMSRHACAYAKRHYDMERIVEKICYLIFGEGIYDGKTFL